MCMQTCVLYIYIYTIVYSLIICVHSVCKLCFYSCKRRDTMTMTVHGHALLYLQIAPACLKRGCLLIAQPVARARRFNTMQMAPVCLFTPREAIHLSPPVLLPIPAFPWPQDRGVAAPLGSCSALLVPGSLPGWSGGALNVCLARHAARQQRGPFISPLLLSVCPELAGSYVPSARRLARLAFEQHCRP